MLAQPPINGGPIRRFLLFGEAGIRKTMPQLCLLHLINSHEHDKYFSMLESVKSDTISWLDFFSGHLISSHPAASQIPNNFEDYTEIRPPNTYRYFYRYYFIAIIKTKQCYLIIPEDFYQSPIKNKNRSNPIIFLCHMTLTISICRRQSKISMIE